MAFLMVFAVSACNKTPEKEPVEHGKTEEATTENNNVINPLTGEKTLSPAAVGKRPIAVVVQNSGLADRNGVCAHRISSSRGLPRVV